MKVLVIQTAFPGDVILASALVEKLHEFHPTSQIDFLLRKGNENLFSSHPFLKKLLVWDKKQNKVSELLRIISEVRRERYDYVINLQRYASSGFITAFSGAKNKIGFDKNPLAFLFTQKFQHKIGDGTHEINRNQQLITSITDSKPGTPKIYPSEKDLKMVSEYKNTKYVCIAPSSVWFTKQWPAHKWTELIQRLVPTYSVYLIGAPSDFELCEKIKSSILNYQSSIINFSGKFSFLESAALMKDALMNYVNDSAPMHLASAVNAPVTAVFCSTVPEFGFGPLSNKSFIAQTKEKLTCRPCGLHGKISCPEKHFDCAESIKPEEIFSLSLTN
ncbi:MAG: Lipopolysaccharide core heptosyltransferase RfaQ [Bacteroidia bacterium]|nr:Lipopolysaccharide core heptosyltransferase RfaQ [Bacteroidia bacterium]